MVTDQLLSYYSHPGPMTEPGKYVSHLNGLPDDIGELVRIVQGLLIYEHVAGDFYGVRLPEARKQESHIRTLQGMLDKIFELDPRPLSDPRPPEKRLVGVCHHFIVLLVGILRAKGVPARDRWGFGAYFNPGYYEDHVLCEYWHDGHWQRADPQFDDVWKDRLHIKHTILDVPHDAFLLAAEVWQQCRAGKIDPATVGIEHTNMRGLWFPAGSLVRDVAALNKVEMLQWDVWGAQPEPDAKLSADQLAFFDSLAVLTADADEHFKELQSLYTEKSVHVPPKVFNAMRQKEEPAS